MEPGSLGTTTAKDLHKALARRLAHRDIRDDAIAAVSKRMVADGLKIGGFDFCPYGICIDYFSDRPISIDGYLKDRILRAVKLFPYGVVADDLWRLQVELHAPELNGGRG